MFPAGEVRFHFPEIKPVKVPVDLDETYNFYPNLSTYPVDNDGCDDFVSIQSENSELHPGDRRLRFQFFSEIGGVWGLKTPDKKGGWAQYSIVLEVDGNIYAQRMIDGATQIYEAKHYHFSDFVGPKNTALVNILAESLAGLAIQQQLQAKVKNPLYQLATHLDQHREKAWQGIPTELLQKAVAQLNTPQQLNLTGGTKQPHYAKLDIDDSTNGFVSAGSVAVAETTSNDGVSVETLHHKLGIALHFYSEVKVPEAGSGNRNKNGKLDSPAPRIIQLDEAGIHVFAADDNSSNELKPVAKKNRISGMSAVALTTLGSKFEDFTLSKVLLGHSSEIYSKGEEVMPQVFEIQMRDSMNDGLSQAAWGGG